MRRTRNTTELSIGVALSLWPSLAIGGQEYGDGCGSRVGSWPGKGRGQFTGRIPCSRGALTTTKEVEVLGPLREYRPTVGILSLPTMSVVGWTDFKSEKKRLSCHQVGGDEVLPFPRGSGPHSNSQQEGHSE